MFLECLVKWRDKYSLNVLKCRGRREKGGERGGRGREKGKGEREGEGGESGGRGEREGEGEGGKGEGDPIVSVSKLFVNYFFCPVSHSKQLMHKLLLLNINSQTLIDHTILLT